MLPRSLRERGIFNIAQNHDSGKQKATNRKTEGKSTTGRVHQTSDAGETTVIAVEMCQRSSLTVPKTANEGGASAWTKAKRGVTVETIPGGP